MTIKEIKAKIFYAASVGISIFLLFIVITFSWISYEVKNQCLDAQREYGGNCVESLVSLLNDENKSYRSKNDAIWTLGQLSDNRALPILKSYYTGNIPAREPLDKMISQYELKKAIQWCETGNLTSWMYKNRDSWH